MEDATSREKVLKKIRKALIQKGEKDVGVNIDLDSEIYQVSDDPKEIVFAQNFTSVNGHFVFCESEEEFLNTLPQVLNDNKSKSIYAAEEQIKNFLSKANVSFTSDEKQKDIDTGITLCECLVARTGSVYISSRLAGGRIPAAYSPLHFVVAYTDQLFMHQHEALKFIRSKYNDQFPSMVVNITGPSRTADIEKTLVQGAHGPKEIFVFLIDKN